MAVASRASAGAGPDRQTALRLVRFGLIGAATTLLYAGLAWLFGRGLHWPAALASAAAYGACATLSYWGHRKLTFRSREPHRVALPRFAATTAGGYAAALAVPVVLGAFGFGFELAILLTCLAIPLANFVVLDRLVFRRRRGAEAAPGGEP